MEIDIFAVCDFAQDVAGKLTVVGTFDTIFVPKLPAVLPICSIAARVRLQKKNDGLHSFKIIISDSNNKEIAPPFSQDITVQKKPDNDLSAVNIVVIISPLQLSCYGKYFVNLSIDGEKRKSIPFSVKESPK